ncbi:unnamed protein product [Sphagnum tenellum]
MLSFSDYNNGIGKFTQDGLKIFSDTNSDIEFGFISPATALPPLNSGIAYQLTESNFQPLLAVLPTGSVGLGTLSPSSQLTLKGGSLEITTETASQISEGTPNQLLFSGTHAATDVGTPVFGISGGAGTKIVLFPGTAASFPDALGIGPNSDLWSLSPANLTFFTSGSEKMRINAQGYIGIGTTTPSQPLQVIGNINSTGNLFIGSTTVITLPGTASPYEVGGRSVFSVTRVASGSSTFTASTTTLSLFAGSNATFEKSASGILGWNPGSGAYSAPLSGYYKFNLYVRAASTTQTVSVIPAITRSSTGSTSPLSQTGHTDHTYNSAGNPQVTGISVAQNILQIQGSSLQSVSGISLTGQGHNVVNASLPDPMKRGASFYYSGSLASIGSSSAFNNAGVGTSVPAERLDVVGDLHIQGQASTQAGSAVPQAMISFSDYNYGIAKFTNSGIRIFSEIQTGASNRMIFSGKNATYDSGSPSFGPDGSGGAGTKELTPLFRIRKLDVNGNLLISGSLKFGGVTELDTSAYALGYRTLFGADRHYDNDLGAPAPGPNGGQGTKLILLPSSSALNYGDALGYGVNSDLWYSSPNGLTFYTSGTPRLRINSSGQVGINNSSPTQSLDINGTLGVVGNFMIGGSLSPVTAINSLGYEVGNRAVFNVAFSTSTSPTYWSVASKTSVFIISKHFLWNSY